MTGQPAPLTRAEIDAMEMVAHRPGAHTRIPLAAHILCLVAHVRAVEARLDSLAEFLWETEPDPECEPGCHCHYDWARERVEAQWAAARADREEATDD